MADLEVKDAVGRDADFGQIYAARLRNESRPVVLRYCLKEAGMSEAEWEAAKRHVRKLVTAHAPLNTLPSVIAPCTLVEEGEWLYIATYPEESSPLRHLLAVRGPQRLTWALNILEQIAQILESAGQKGLIHGGLNSDTVFLKQEGNRPLVCVTDFGIAHLRPRSQSPYEAPELFEGMPPDARSDVYAAGALLFEMLSGKTPPTVRGAASESKNRFSYLLELLPDQPAYVRDVLSVMLSPYPTRRYGRLLQALADLRKEHSPSAARSAQLPPDAATLARDVYDERFSGYVVRDGILISVAAQPAAAKKELPPTPVFEEPAEPETASVAEVGEAAERIIEEWREEEGQKANRRKGAVRRHRARIAATVLSLAALAAYVSARYSDLRSDYANGTVIAVAGKPQLVLATDGSTRPLQVGDPVDDRDASRIATDGSSTVVLQLHGSRVKIAPSSVFQIESLGFQQGVIRQFRVLQGSAAFSVEPLRGSHPDYAVAFQGFTAHVKGTRFRVGVNGNGGEVQTASGAVRVDGPAADPALAGLCTVPAGQRWGASGTGQPPTTTTQLADADQRTLANDPDLELPEQTLASLEESCVLTLGETVQAVTDLVGGKYYRDTAAVTEGRWAAGALCDHLLADGAEGIPQSLNLTTLEPLSLDQAQREKILHYFQGDRLLYYRSLKDGYEFEARARDSKGTLIRARNHEVILIEPK